MSNQLDKQDVFFELLQTQTNYDVPAEIESRLMMTLVPEIKLRKTSFSMQPFFVFGLLSCFYVIVSLISSFYFPNTPELSDIKLLVLTALLVFSVYKLNDVLPDLLNQSQKLGKMHTS